MVSPLLTSDKTLLIGEVGGGRGWGLQAGVLSASLLGDEALERVNMGLCLEGLV